MTAKAFVAELAERGVTLEATAEGNLRYAPKDKLAQPDIERLKAHKQEILKFFSAGKSNVPSPSSPPSPPPQNPDAYGKFSGDSYGDGYGDDATQPSPKHALVRQAKERADRLGLVARWSFQFGYISIHDPVEGEWHDVEREDAPGWAKREAFKRKELWKSGNKRAFDLTAREMGELWEEEQVEMWDHPAVTDKGIVYEDYLGEE